MGKILEILKRLRPDVDFASEKELVDAGILSSFDIFTLVEELSDAFDIDIETDDIVPQNFNSVEGMERLVQRVQDGEKNT